MLISTLQVQPITLLKFDYKLEHTQQVAISSSYICYGLKAGHIRALNRNTASRALFKGHPTSLSHMAFFSAADNLLASASRQGDLAVRLVTDGKGPDGDAVPAETLLMRAQLQLPPGADASSSSSPLVSLAWHPSTPQILAAGAAGSVNIFQVPTAAPAEQPPALVDPGIQYTLPSSGSNSAAVTAVAFSPAGDLLVAADSAGSVHVWWLEGDGEEGEAPMLSWQPFGGSSTASAAAAAAVASVQFLHQAADGSSILMTGDARNAALKLWLLPAAAALNGASPVCLQSVQCVSSANGPSDVFCHVVVQRDLQLVVLANTVRKQVYTLHYSLSSSAAASVTAAAAAAFDYAAFWGVKQPILSLAAGLEAVESQEVPGEVPMQQLLLYTVQTDAIQQYFINPALCSSSSGIDEAPEAAALAPADEASAAAGGAAAAAADVEEGEEVSSSITAAPVQAAAAPAAEPEPAAAAAAEAEAPVTAAVPPPAQLPTPGLLLHAKASEQEAPAQEAAAAEQAAAASSEAEAASPAAAADSEKQSEAATAHENASTTTVVPVALPPMPTSSLLHSAEKATAATAAAPADAAEVPTAVEASAPPPAAAVPVAAVASADVAALQQQVAQLLEMQQAMAAQLQANSQQTVAGEARCLAVAFCMYHPPCACCVVCLLCST
jgi:enhancer of mRNA-decapping protein 4